MRHGCTIILVAQFALSASAGAQRPSIILVPEITHGFEHEIYRGVLHASTLEGAHCFENSWVELEPGTRYGLHVEVLTGSGAWGAFVAYGARDTKMRSGGGDLFYSFRRVQDAEIQIFTQMPEPVCLCAAVVGL